jgi:hypothetical protein
MTYRFYLTTRIGDGATHQTAMRSKLANFIVNDGTKDFWSWGNRATPFFFCLAFCDSALHATIVADIDIVALSPELADSGAITIYLDGLVGTLPVAISNALEAAGIPIDWIIAGTTRRQLWRFISAWHFINQRMTQSERTFLANNLDATIGSLTVAARNQISAWMTAHGNLDTTWITGPTLVRAVVKFIIQNGNFPIMGNGPVSF